MWSSWSYFVNLTIPHREKISLNVSSWSFFLCIIVEIASWQRNRHLMATYWLHIVLLFVFRSMCMCSDVSVAICMQWCGCRGQKTTLGPQPKIPVSTYYLAIGTLKFGFTWVLGCKLRSSHLCNWCSNQFIYVL